MCLNDPQIWQFIFQAKLQDHLKEKNLCYMCVCVCVCVCVCIYIERERFCSKKIDLFTQVKDKFINQTSTHDVWNGLCHQHYKLLQLPVLCHITTLDNLP